MPNVLAGIFSVLMLLQGAVAAVPGAEQASNADGATLFAQNCVECHNGSVPRAPHLITFNMMSEDSILKVMNPGGAMERMADHLDAQQRGAIAAYLSESASAPSVPPARCESDEADVGGVGNKAWTGWGGAATNHRHVPEAVGVIDKAALAGLTLKWVFAYPDATRARSQPLVHDGKVFVGSQHGAVYALDLDTGCAHWIYEAGAEVRNGPSMVDVAGVDAPLVVFGDFDARIHAVNSRTGAQVWVADVATHDDATITGSVNIVDGTVYVPISSSEWATAADPGYACCTFRGSVTALDAATGKRLWNSYVIPDSPKETGAVNAHGAKRFGPSGAPVWNSPTVDRERGLLYVGTGEAYTSPASESSDAVIAMRLSDGAIVWRKQLLAGDAWNMACFIGGGTNCPEENGPDLDIGATTILWQGEQRSLLFVGQKSGDVYALDPDSAGEIVWHRKLGRGGFVGGVHWGMATDGETLFVPMADTLFPGLSTEGMTPGMHALDPLTGESRWYVRPEDSCPQKARLGCDIGLSAAATSTPGVLYAGGFDGFIRAYDSATGEVLWQFDTANTFTAVNGAQALGGSIESDGPVIAEGHLLINSGYQFGGRMPGNALLVFAPADQES